MPVLICDDCGKKSPKLSRYNLVERGWNWTEIEHKIDGIIRVAYCENCFNAEKMQDEIVRIAKKSSSGISEKQKTLEEVEE